MSARAVVVGGGIAGLAAAHRLVERLGGPDAGLEIAVLEGDARPGGHVRTVREDGYVLEAGPDTLLTQKPWGIALCERVGLGPDLEDLSAGRAGTDVVRSSRLVRVPDGFLMMAPTRTGPLLRSPLFSWRAKVRMLAEPWVPRRAAAVDDESLASFVARRFGREVLERVAEPVLAGLYTADAERLSLRMTMPRLLDLEASERSVTRALRRAARAAGARPFGHGTGRGAFVTVRGGLGRLVDALVARLPEGSVRTGSLVSAIAASPGGWTVRLDGGETLAADAVVLACPAFEGARILEGHDPALASELRRLDYSSCATVNLAYRRGSAATPPGSYGFFVPRVESLPLLACSYVSAKFPGRVPDGAVAFRAFLGGAARPGALDADDAALAEAAHATLRALLPVRGEPLLARVHRFPRAMPQLEVGSRAWAERVRALVAGHAGLALAGSATGAVGLPDCIRSGEEAAERIAAHVARDRGAARVSA